MFFPGLPISAPMGAPLSRIMDKKLQVERGRDIAKQFAGQWLAFNIPGSSVERAGRVIGWRPEWGEIVLESLDGADAVIADAVMVAPKTKGFLNRPDEPNCVTSKTKYWVVDSEAVIARPLYPRKKLIEDYPHLCSRCGSRSLKMFQWEECSWWRCASYYLKS